LWSPERRLSGWRSPSLGLQRRQPDRRAGHSSFPHQGGHWASGRARCESQSPASAL